MTVRALPGLLALPLLVLGLLAGPAGAATSQNCSGALSSVDGKGATVGSVTVPGPGGTEAQPFRLLWGDPVTWTAQTAQPVTSGTWHLTVDDPSWLFAVGQTLAWHPHGLSGTFASGQGGQALGVLLLFAFGITKITRPVLERPGGSVR